MSNPITPYTIEEAIEDYAGNPVVRCIANEAELRILSNTLHAEKPEGWPHHWIWAYSEEQEDGFKKSMLLYGPSQHDADKYVKADIIPDDIVDNPEA